MIENPGNPRAIENDNFENEELENEPFEPGMDEEEASDVPLRPTRQEARLAGDDPVDLEDAVAALDNEEPDDLGSGSEHERIPDRTQQRGHR